MMIRHLLLATILLVFSTTKGNELPISPGEQVAMQISVAIDDDAGTTVDVPFLLYVPEAYQAEGDPCPLVMFLHGYGESGDGGDELQRVATHGPPKQLAAGQRLPFIVVSPQCPKPGNMGEVVAAWRPEVLLALLDHIQDELNVDEERIYLTGLSMGGFGSWRLAAAAPERFAAVVPICGGGDSSGMAEHLTDLPVWAFHGAKDSVVPLQRSQEMVDAVNQAGGHARLTIYPDAGHDSWTATYDNPMLYDWLLGLKITSAVKAAAAPSE